MSEIYIVLVVILFALAISDIIVGVSNDAVNFLNSAIGSKSAPKWMIFGVASLGVLVGATFSSGMMEVARNGIFNPQMFVFSDVMVICLAVMITDIILLDVFNSLGLPTSTTVSVVFELLGSAVAVAMVKMNVLGLPVHELGKFINTQSAFFIIFGILVSVVISFTVGSFIHWLTRILFSFRYEKRLKLFGAVYGGFAISMLTYFMIIKGAKGASFISPETAEYMKNNMMLIILYSFIGWSLLLQLLDWLFKIDILKIIVLAGTFSLAMAFAGNDLVNFIGVPLMGYSSFQDWVVSGTAPELFTMDSLNQKVQTPTYMLIIAGIIMAVTLITSRKARTVIKTSVDLGNQNEGSERFGSSTLSRFVVKESLKIGNFFTRLTPSAVSRFIDRQFIPAPVNEAIPLDQRPAFDKLRAASALIVSSILISTGTSLKLPLSTTYVTFMVAMGTSFVDRSWGRESAVYRVSGVFAVIGGWFLTAFVAFTVSFILAQVMMWGGTIAILTIVVLATLVLIRTQIAFYKKNKKPEPEEDEDIIEQQMSTVKVIDKCNKNTIKAIISTSKAYFLCFQGFFEDERHQLKNALLETESFNAKAKKNKDNVYKNIVKLQQDSIDTGHFYVQVVDYIREMAHSLHYIVEPVFTHYENNHKPFIKEQKEQFNVFTGLLNEFFNFALHLLKEKNFELLEELIEKRNVLLTQLNEIEKSQIKRIKNKEVSTRNSMLYFKIISETKNLLFHLVNVVKAQRDFIQNSDVLPEK